jgi:hypothetical protein
MKKLEKHYNLQVNSNMIFSIIIGNQQSLAMLNIVSFDIQNESTLQWPPLGCHIVFLSMDVHVWVYPTSNFWKKITILLYIMLEYNLNKILGKKKIISFYKVGDWRIFVKKNVVYLCTKKHKYIPKIIFMIFNFYEN